MYKIKISIVNLFKFNIKKLSTYVLTRRQKLDFYNINLRIEYILQFTKRTKNFNVMKK